MTKKLVSLLLVCLILAGCGKTFANSAGDVLSPSEERQISNTENASEATNSSTAGTEETAPLEDILPDPVSFWNPICNEYISLFASAESKEAVSTIPRNATIGLIRWEGKYAQVVYNGQVGYVYSNCLKPADTNYFTDKLKVLSPTTKYTYEQMQADMTQLQALYPQLIRISSIGKSEMGRNIPVMIVGQDSAKYHVLIQGAIHGREHFTAWLAMAMADYVLLQGFANNVCYHIIPMSNPDGVIISQTGKLEEEQMIVYDLDLDYGYVYSNLTEYATQWKANAYGVDLNRNFLAGWIPSDDHPEKSSEKYRGCGPFSAAESQALERYTTQRTFHATISLHSHGSVLYYKYGTKQPVNQLSYSLAQAVAGVTGYIPTAFDNTTGAGYKDWAMDELGIPSLTVEIGNYTTPLVQQDIYNTFDRCREMLPTIYNWLCQNGS